MAEGKPVDLNKQVFLEDAGGAAVTLADLAGIDLDDVKEKRGLGPFPKGSFRWKVEEAKLDTFEKEIENVKRNVPCAKFVLIPTKIIAVLDPEKNTEEGHAQILSRKFAFMIGIQQADDVGRVKALLVDSGYKGSGKMQVLLDGFKGHEFIAPIVHKKNKDDPDNPYANMDFRKIEKVTEEGAAA